MNRSYSRLQSVEEKRNTRSALLFIGLTLVVILVLVFAGVPALTKFVSFVSGLKKNSGQSISNDTTPPAPPRFNLVADFTNQQTATISGNSEPGATVYLTFNGTDQNVVVDKDGNFSFSVQLNDGDNIFSAVAIDSAKNKSHKTQDYKITYDTKTPDLNITSPADGAQFTGSLQRQVTIQGTTESTAQVTINDRIIPVDDNGKFQYTTTLSDGANKFAVKAIDQAGNTSEKDLTLNFSS